ncbi:MAG: sulfite exporter TauE/SafE family protein [Ruminococcus sp.]|nr:sulfite exporter TauE/SafE family protein [Ruminococcus sp.]
MKEKSVKLKITGMSCEHCREKISNALLSENGLIDLKLTLSGDAQIVFDEECITLEKITDVIKELGYGVKSSGGLLYPVLALAVIFISFILLDKTNVLKLLVPSQLADASMSYGMLFLIGITTSVHCIAMCGGINLTQSLPKSSQNCEGDYKGKKISAKTFLSALQYNIGRVVSYTATGAALGFIGTIIGGSGDVSDSLQGFLKIIAGLFMLAMGLRMIGLSMPFFSGSKLFSKLKINRIFLKVRKPFLVGILNGFMPCGPLQAMQIVALASGSALTGGLSMFFFALGTIPLMLGFGAAVSALGRKFTPIVYNIGAVLICIFGIAMLAQGGNMTNLYTQDTLLLVLIFLSFTLLCLGLPSKLKKAIGVCVTTGVCLAYAIGLRVISSDLSDENSIRTENGRQLVNSVLLSGSYPDITVRLDMPVEWTITAEEGSINGCNYMIYISEYDISYEFKEGENVIEFTPTERGDFTYTCWMGMITGTIHVV